MVPPLEVTEPEPENTIEALGAALARVPETLYNFAAPDAATGVLHTQHALRKVWAKFLEKPTRYSACMMWWQWYHERVVVTGDEGRRVAALVSRVGAILDTDPYRRIAKVLYSLGLKGYSYEWSKGPHNAGEVFMDARGAFLWNPSADTAWPLLRAVRGISFAPDQVSCNTDLLFRELGGVVPNAPQARSKEDPVNHPPHYTAHPSGVECIQITRHMNFCRGNAMKYLWRAGEKDPEKELEDLKKAQWYIAEEIRRLENK